MLLVHDKIDLVPLILAPTEGAKLQFVHALDSRAKVDMEVDIGSNHKTNAIYVALTRSLMGQLLSVYNRHPDCYMCISFHPLKTKRSAIWLLCLAIVNDLAEKIIDT